MTKLVPLNDIHIELGAKMTPFGGFNMPLQYTSAKEEILAVRNEVGVFDVSHMGEFFVEGPQAVDFIDYIITNDFKSAQVGKAVYSPLCNFEGKVIDDLIAYKISEDLCLICVNAANIDKDWDWISSVEHDFNCKISNRSEEYSLLALQGPKSEEVLKSILSKDSEKISALDYYQVAKLGDLIIARTGYTGEDGFELFCSNSKVTELWPELLRNNVKPCGLASRDTLRLEVGFPLYGHELSDDLMPTDSALKWTLSKSDADYIGKESIGNNPPKYQLIKLSLEKGIPREGHLIKNKNEETIGHVTSGTFSPTINQGICFALVEKSLFSKEDELFIEIRGKVYPAKRHLKSFLPKGTK